LRNVAGGAGSGMTAPVRQWIAALAVGCCALLAAFLATPFGRPILAHDSLIYYEAATSLANGTGLAYSGETPGIDHVPLTVWAPAYPVLLAAFHKYANVSLDQAASIVNFGALFAAIFLFYVLARKRTGVTLAALLAVILCFEHPIQFAGAHALSEALFLPFPLLTIYFCEKYFDTDRMKYAALAGFAAALCALTRHAGAIFAILAPLAILLFSRAPFRRRIAAVGSCGLMESVILIPLWLRNFQLTGAFSGSNRGGGGSWSRIPTDIDALWTILVKLSFAGDAVVEFLLFWPLAFLSVYALARLVIRKPEIVHDRLLLIPVLFACGYFAFFLFARITQNQIDMASIRMLNILWPLAFLAGAALLGKMITLKDEHLALATVAIVLSLRVVTNEEVLRRSHERAGSDAVPVYMLTYGTNLYNFRPESPMSRAMLARIGDTSQYDAFFSDIRPHVIQHLTGIRTYRWSAQSTCEQLMAAGARGMVVLEQASLADKARACAVRLPSWKIRVIKISD
jgi:hypothetical protein